uniref:phosphatidate phosphatase n=1 Tax=Labrus bergylta TaxID=56723 RepID=A0A3Q3G0K8_9LABR
MNIVGHFAETVFVTVKELYRGLNPATLTGGIDVIVVRQPNGSFQCSPFHVRFGKLGVLRSKEKIVDIEINGESVDLHMKLGDNGEAFFVEENENMESQVPAHLCTSPIPLETSEELEETGEGSIITGSGARKKKRRRKRIRSDSHLRDEAGSSSDERERQRELERESDQAGQEMYYSLSEEPSELAAMQSRDTHPHSDEEQSPSDSVFLSLATSPKSDSELVVKPQGSSGPQIEWNWGAFPVVCKHPVHSHINKRISPSGSSHFCTIERQDSFNTGYQPVISCGRVGRVTVVRPQPRTQSLDLGSLPMQTPPLSKEKNSHIRSSFIANLIDGTNSPACKESTTSVELINTETDVISPKKQDSETDLNNAQIQLIKDSEECSATRSDLQMQSASSEHGEQGSTSSPPVSEGDSGIYPWAEGGEEDRGPKADGRDTATSWTTVEASANSSEVSSKVEQVEKKKGDILFLTLQINVPHEAEGSSQHGAEQGSYSGSQSPQSVGSGAMDSGTEYLSDSTSYNMDVSMSLCGQEGDTSQITKEKFMEHIVTYQDFANNPGIIEDPSLVVCINSNYYNWAAAAPMVLSMTTFQKNLPKGTIDRLMKDKMPKKSGRWWFSWRRRDMDNNQKISKEEQDEPLASVAGLGRKATLPVSLSTETLSATQCISQMYRKSLRLTSEQIEHLNLREGANKVVFSVTTQYQGTCRCEAAIYLWNWNDRIIISDIDGTITKSDALGHILPQFGKDWTHKGIAKLYHKIHQNGYKFLYCSARAIGMAAITKDYLQWVNDQGTVLPKGPVLLAPSSLFSALHREVIEKKPEVFKIACLGDIRDLFNPQRRPFYAAFGNRTNDAYAYKQVGVPDTRLFTVNPKGELIQEKTKGNKSSYSHLSELVEHFFPMLSVEGSMSFALDCPEYSSFSYWKEALPELDLDALL